VRRSRRAVVVAVVVGAAAFVGWLLSSESSPLYQYFLYHVAWPNRLALLNLPAVLIAVALSGSVHAPEEWALWVGFLAWWIPIGYGVSLLVVRRRSGPPAEGAQNGAA
jgi:hypothetical protein